MTRTVAESTSLAIIGAVLAGPAGHWFITPMRHPNASGWKVALVAAQLLLGAGCLAYAAILQRRERRSESLVEEPNADG